MSAKADLLPFVVRQVSKSSSRSIVRRRDWVAVRSWPGRPVRSRITELPLKAAEPALWTAWPPLTASDLRLLGDFEGVIDLDAEVPHGRFQLGVPE